MSVNLPETTVAIGMTDGFRYVFVKPPLTEEEISSMKGQGEIAPSFTIEQIDDIDPACTSLTVSGELDIVSPDERTAHAKRAAVTVAGALRSLREGPVQHNLRPIQLNGDHRTPFNPDTDALGQ